MATPDESRGWSLNEGKYTRPLVGSEILADGEPIGGHGEPCMGISFKTTLENDTVIQSLLNAVVRLRYGSPIVAATMMNGESGRYWSYEPARDAGEIEEWARNTLHVRYDSPDEVVISEINQTRLPYTHPSTHRQYFALHLILRSEGTHSLLIHGTHSIFDGRPTLDVLHLLFEAMSSGSGSSDFTWGTESSRLPPNVITATGGPAPLAPIHEAPEITRIVSSGRQSEGFHPARTEIQTTGKPVRVRRCVPVGPILQAIKPLGVSITVLLEAAQILTTFRRSQKVSADGPLPEATHVTLDMSVIALQNKYVPPYNERPWASSALTYVPVGVSWGDVLDARASQSAPVTDANHTIGDLVFIAQCLRGQYERWLQYPTLRLLGTLGFRPVEGMPMNPYGAVVTNLGAVDKILKSVWTKDGASEPAFEIQDVILGHRIAGFHRATTHVWTYGGNITLQIQSCDIYNADYLQGFLDEIVQMLDEVVASKKSR